VFNFFFFLSHLKLTSNPAISLTVKPNDKDSDDYISFESLSPADAKTRLMEMLEELLLPDVTSLRLTFYCVRKPAFKAQKTAVTKLLNE